ncbi:hypothetical protein PRJ39_25225 [Lysobacter enzymogenes]|uniref:hypothetical protein n=1 Tax=Lysobacter enzymogenes TaxID=69 RepID=UPI003748FC48
MSFHQQSVARFGHQFVAGLRPQQAVLEVEGVRGLLPARQSVARRADLGRWRVQGGIGRMFWGVTESRHLVNIVNPADLRFDSGGLSSLGQPLLSASTHHGDAQWQALALPCHRPRARQVGADGARSDTFAPIRCGRSDYALRYRFSKGPLDLGLVRFDGLAREPWSDAQGERYPRLRRWSADAQLTLGAWLLKLEAARDARPGYGARRASVVGFEYALSFVGTRLDYGLLYEHLEQTGCAPLTCGDMVGLRLSANDAAGSELLASALKDRTTGHTLYVLRGQRRIGERYQLRVDGNRFGSERWLSLSAAYHF